jgi:hypothetical protein
MTHMARNLGQTRNRIGEMPMTSRASISSEMRMVAISAVKAAPARPDKIRQVSRGPSSVMMEKPTRLAT